MVEEAFLEEIHLELHTSVLAQSLFYPAAAFLDPARLEQPLRVLAQEAPYNQLHILVAASLVILRLALQETVIQQVQPSITQAASLVHTQTRPQGPSIVIAQCIIAIIPSLERVPI
jgi:hypothetical protein